MKLYISLMLVAFLVGCNSPASKNLDDDFPACQKEFSQKGTEQAFNALMDEYQKTIEIVGDKDDLFLIQEIKNLQGNGMKIEDWVCRAQRKYGRPEKTDARAE